MEILNPKVDLDRFFTELNEAPSSLLMLDYDGTLAPFQTERDKAVPYPGVREVLEQVTAKTRTRVVIVSGRSCSDLKPLIGLDPAPEMWGCHGAERCRVGEEPELLELDANVREGFSAAFIWVSENGLERHLEQKPASLAMHWRGVEEAQAKALEVQIRAGFESIVSSFGFSLHDFDGGVDLIVPGISKARAVDSLLGETGLAATAAYLGDDLTDEDAFKALVGRGLRVLVRPELRETSADIWLKPPEEMLDFLKRWHSVAAVEH